MKVSFILLAHEKPDQLKGLIQSLLSAGSDVYLHHDLSAPYDIKVEAAKWNIQNYTGELYFADRIRVVWGEWSIIQATLNCLALAQDKGLDSDYYMLISGSCAPIKPVKYLEQYLAKSESDHIETVDATQHRWVMGGLQEERWERYHLFNWRYQPKRFDLALIMQRLLKIKRALPLKHVAHMGSQWWCLRASTIRTLLDTVEKNPSLVSFYRKTWIPDELFFQTLVANLIPDNEINSRLLTRYKFNSLGIPRVYYDDDYPELLAEELFFARKVSHRALSLREKLYRIAALPIAAYKELLVSAELEKNQLLATIKLNNDVKDNAWYSLVNSHENKFDYIKSIPNPFVIVISDNHRLKTDFLSALDSHQATKVYGDLFSNKAVGYGYHLGDDTGLSESDTALAQHRSFHVLGDIAYKNSDKIIVFSLGSEYKKYIQVLKWKHNAHFLLPDSMGDVRDERYLKELYFNSLLLLDLHDTPGQVSRVDIKTLACNLENYENNKNINSLFNYLSVKTIEAGWPSLTLSNDHYDVIKNITSPLICFILDKRFNRNISDLITNDYEQQLYSNVFNCVEKYSVKYNKWHFYLADLIHKNELINSNSPCFISIQLSDITCLNTLRWSSRVLVIDLQSADDKRFDNFNYKLSGNIDFISDFQSSISNQHDLYSLMSDRACSYSKLDPEDANNTITGVINLFLDELKREDNSKIKLPPQING